MYTASSPSRGRGSERNDWGPSRSQPAQWSRLKLLPSAECVRPPVRKRDCAREGTPEFALRDWKLCLYENPNGPFVLVNPPALPERGARVYVGPPAEARAHTNQPLSNHNSSCPVAPWKKRLVVNAIAVGHGLSVQRCGPS